jgi:CopG family transcriptional regulator / antitoxin EndoAI
MFIKKEMCMNTVTVNISFQDSLLSDIDSVAKQERRTRSDLLREAARMYIDRKTRWNKIFAYGESRAAQLNVSAEDISTEIHAYRKQKNRKK